MYNIFLFLSILSPMLFLGLFLFISPHYWLFLLFAVYGLEFMLLGARF